jgi:cysteine-S-conjugate beta-lyase
VSGSDGFGQRQATDPETLRRRFGTRGPLLPLWIAEPGLAVSPELIEAFAARSAGGLFGYETRPDSIIAGFWEWMAGRHAWDGSSLRTLVSPSVGTSIGALIDLMTGDGDGVILQPPVFTDFKPLVVGRGRQVVRNPLLLGRDGYEMDLDQLERCAADLSTRMLIICNPHNPVGRVWTVTELDAVAGICARHDVFVLADEIHADLALAPHAFVPFAAVAEHHDVAWAATHGPIKTFGLAGVCDTLLITADDKVADRFAGLSARLHLTRNNVFGILAFDTAYRHCGGWVDELSTIVRTNLEILRERLPREIRMIEPEGTYLAWLDLRALGLDVAGIPEWLGAAGLALSPGHWFGREGAGFARMTIAAPAEMISRAADLLASAVDEGSVS